METKIQKLLHKYHIFTELILLLALVPFVFLFVIGGSVKGEQKVVAGVQSHLVVEYDTKAYEFETFKTTISDALAEQGIETYKQDEFSLSRSTRLYGQDVRLHIKKSLPIIIYDNADRVVGRTTKTSPEEILEQNEIEFWPEDVLESELITDPVKEGGAGQLVRITRAPVFLVYVDEEVKEIRSWALNVKGVLEGNVSLGERDIVEPPLESFAEPGGIHITRINVVDTELIAPISYKTVTQNDYYLPEGTSSVVVAGVNGSKRQEIRIRYENGEEVSRVVLSEVVTKTAKSQVVKKGLMPSNRLYFNETYWNYMVEAGVKYGVNPLDLFTVAACESRMRPYAESKYYSSSNTKYWGLYQYGSTGYYYTGGLFTTYATKLGFNGMDWGNAKAQIYVTAYIVNQEGSWKRWGCKP